MSLFEPVSDESLYQNRGALEESLLNTTKLLESLDKNNRFDDVGEYNYLLTGMEGLLGQFSENHYELHHEIKEIMESSRMGLLTHEKLVEMVTAEQLRSQYLSNIVGSLKDQIENLFTTILTAVENRNGSDPEDLMDKVSNNVNLMWKSVESMSKVISSPTKRLDQTIRKIDSEVVVHLSKTVQNNDTKKESFTDKLDKRLQKARVNEEKRRSKLLESDSDSDNGSQYVDRPPKRSSRQSHDDDNSTKKGHEPSHATPHNRHLDPHHTDSVPSSARDHAHPPLGHPTGVATAATATTGSVASKGSTSSQKEDKKSKKKDKKSSDSGSHKEGHAKDSLVFDDNSSLGGASMENSIENADGDQVDEDSVSRMGESGRHHKKHHHKKSRKDKNQDNGKSGDGDEVGSARGSNRNSRRPSFDDASETSKTSRHRHRGSAGKRGSTDTAVTSPTTPGSAMESDYFITRLEEEKRKWDKERSDWQKAFEAQQLVEVQRTIYRTIIPMLDLHKINSEEYKKILESLTTETDTHRLSSLVKQLSVQQQQQFGGGAYILSSVRSETNTIHTALSTPGGPLPTPTTAHLMEGDSSSNAENGAKSTPMIASSQFEDPSLQEFAQCWTSMDADQKGLLLALTNHILFSNSNNSTGLQQMSSIIDQDRLVQFLQEQLSHFSGVLPSNLDHHKEKKLSRSNSYIERQGRTKDRKSRHHGLTGPGHSHSRSPSSTGKLSHSDDDAWSLDSHGQRRRRSHTRAHSDAKKSPTHKMSMNNNGKMNKMQAHMTQSLAVQGKKTQKPMTQFLDEQAYHIGQLVKEHMQREGIHDAAYYAVVTDFIQQALANAVKSHGDSGLKAGNTDTLSKNLQWIKISLPEKFKSNQRTTDMGINTDLIMTATNQGSVVGNSLPSVKGNALMTTTTVKTTTTTTMNGAPIQQQQEQTATSQPVSGQGWELPIYDNRENILITRTYRPPEKKEEFLALLQQHSDPLKFLFEEFQPYLSKQDRLKMYFACLNTKDRIEETKTEQNIVHGPDRWVKTLELVHTLHHSVSLLDDETKAMSVIILDLENIIQEAVDIVKVARRSGKTRYMDGTNNNNQSQSNHVYGNGNSRLNSATGFGENSGIWVESNPPLGMPRFEFDDDLADEDHVSRPIASPQGRTSSASNKVSMNYSTKHKFTIDDNNIRLMESHLFDIQRILGELEARVLSANLQQLEFRAFFQTLQASGNLELSSMLKEFAEVQQSFLLSQDIQGRLYEIQQRLLLCQDRCHRYTLFQYIPPQFALPVRPLASAYFDARGNTGNNVYNHHVEGANTHDDGTRNKQTTNSRKHGSVEGLLASMNIHVNVHDPHIAPLLRVIGDLQEDIHVLEEEKEDLELEVMDAMKKQDRAPDALLFFSLMHDPSFVTNLQQMCLQMKQIRGFLDYSVHMDYVMLRKRLQVCMVLAPNIEKLVEKYGLMYKQWSHFRRNWFAERNLRGGSAESFTTCPLCYHSLVDGSGVSPASESTKDRSSGNKALANNNSSSSSKKTNISGKYAAKKRLIAGVAAVASTFANTANHEVSSSSQEPALHTSRQFGQAAAVAAARQDEAMLAAPSSKLIVGGVISSTSSVNTNGSRRVSHSISLPAITAQR